MNGQGILDYDQFCRMHNTTIKFFGRPGQNKLVMILRNMDDYRVK